MTKIHTKSFFLTLSLLIVTSVSGFAADDATIARGGGGGHGGGGGRDFGGGAERGADRGDLDHRGNWGNGYGGWGGDGYVAPVYPDYPFYLPPPTPAEAFPDDASQDSLYKQNQHPPVLR